MMGLQTAGLKMVMCVIKGGDCSRSERKKKT